MVSVVGGVAVANAVTNFKVKNNFDSEENIANLTSRNVALFDV